MDDNNNNNNEKKKDSIQGEKASTDGLRSLLEMATIKNTNMGYVNVNFNDLEAFKRFQKLLYTAGIEALSEPGKPRKAFIGNNNIKSDSDTYTFRLTNDEYNAINETIEVSDVKLFVLMGS